MAGHIIWCCVMFSSAILFFAIGVYAQKATKPMWFWSGTTVDPCSISDVKAYNLENSRMWKLYSLWFFAAGAAYFWNTVIACIILGLSCTVGIGILIGTFLKIEKKYKI